MRASVLFAQASLVLMLSVQPAFARGPHHDKGHGHDHGRDWHEDRHDDHDHRGPDREHWRIVERDRVYVRNYYGKRHRCPPGLARHGCVVPGHAHRYVVGRALPTQVVYQPVPQPLLVQLEPAPVGYQYVEVDGDVLLIALATRMVLDAVNIY